MLQHRIPPARFFSCRPGRFIRGFVGSASGGALLAAHGFRSRIPNRPTRLARPHAMSPFSLSPFLLPPGVFAFPVVLAFVFQEPHSRSLADANPSASGVPVKRWCLGILLRARFAPRADKIPAIPLRAFDIPAFHDALGCLHRLRPCSPSTKGKPHEQQTITPGLRRQHSEGGHRPERLLARSRGRLAAQERKRLRSRHPRRYQRPRSCGLHRAEEGRRHAVTGLPLAGASVSAGGSSCAEQIRQLGGASPLHSLMEVK